MNDCSRKHQAKRGGSWTRKSEAVRLRMEPAIDSGECEEPDVTGEQVAEMLHALLEANRMRREEYEKRSAASRWGRQSGAFRPST